MQECEVTVTFTHPHNEMLQHAQYKDVVFCGSTSTCPVKEIQTNLLGTAKIEALEGSTYCVFQHRELQLGEEIVNQ